MPNTEEKDVFIRITNKDIYAEIQEIHKTTQSVLEQAKKTNGRVTKLENTSMGMWVRNNPIKFAMFSIMFSGFFISDSREFVLGLLKGLI